MSEPKARIRLTAEQMAVVGFGEPRLVVRAAAGAGKTAVLVERFIKHVVEDGIAPDAILTITFTKKAAAEMKRRIVKALELAGRRDAAQTAETGPIQTIHSFCERVLRENSVDAGLDPDFTVLDEADGARMIQEAMRAAISEAEGIEEGLIEVLAGKREHAATSPHAKLEESLRKAFLDMRGSGTSRLEWQERHQNPDALLQFWSAALVAGLEPAVREAFEGEDPALGFVERLRTAHKSLKRKVPKGVPTPEKFEEAHNANLQCARWSAGLVSLCCKTWQAYEARLQGQTALDFTALEEMAVHLVRNREEIRDRLRRQYRIALVDEAQDLSPLQHALLEGMGIEVEMRVGDASQSIYGFRQADVELFNESVLRSSTLALSQNFRSRPGVLAFVDTVFAHLWEQGYLRMLPDPGLDAPPAECLGIELWRQRFRDTSQVAEWIEGLILEGEEPGDVAVLVRTSRYAQDLFSKLESRGVPSRIVGGSERFYTRLEVRDLANALRAIEDPSDDFSLLATLRSPIVGLSLDSIVLLASQKPVAEALESFEPPLEDDQEPLAKFLDWYSQIRLVGDRISAFEAISTIFARSDYLPNLARRPGGRQALANVRKLLQLAASRPESSPKEYAAILREVAELRHREGDAPATNEEDGTVNIMTVHKAKGLEFPVVVLPDTHAPLCRNRGEVEIDKRLGLLTASFGPPMVSLFHEWIAERRKDRERAEELRLLYVGMTRAKRRLCVVADPQARSSSAAKLLSDLLGLPERSPLGAVLREVAKEPPSP